MAEPGIWLSPVPIRWARCGHGRAGGQQLACAATLDELEQHLRALHLMAPRFSIRLVRIPQRRTRASEAKVLVEDCIQGAASEDDPQLRLLLIVSPFGFRVLIESFADGCGTARRMPALSNNRGRWIALAVAVALGVPLLSHPGWRPGLPISWQGDEPHYLVMLTSLIDDGDLDLGNNYASAHRGGRDAGWSMSAQPLLDHQTVWWLGDERIEWCRVFECDYRLWDRDAAGHPKPRAKPGFDRDLSGLVERPIHPAGLPLMLAALVWPFRNTRFIEPAAVTVAYLAMVLAMLLFQALARRWTGSDKRAWITTVAAFLATPVWHYARSLFNEGFLLLIVIAAVWAVTIRDKPLLAGCLIGAGILMKPPFAVVALPFLIRFGGERRWRDGAAILIPCLAGVGGTLLLNWQLYGSPLRQAQPFLWGDPVHGAIGLLFDVRHGLLPLAPILLLAIPGWRRLLREHRADAWLVLGVIAAWFCLIAVWRIWDGAWCYGPRLIVPIIPLCALGLGRLELRRRATYGVMLALGALSVAINATGAVMFWSMYDKNPAIVAVDALVSRLR